jgi:hypothetical protein
MTEDELVCLERFVVSAIEGACIPDWELEALLGCSRVEARLCVESGLRADSDGDGPLLDQLVVLLSALAGSAQLGSRAQLDGNLELSELHRLLARLLGAPTDLPAAQAKRAPELESQIKLRVPPAAAARKKRPA